MNAPARRISSIPPDPQLECLAHGLREFGRVAIGITATALDRPTLEELRYTLSKLGAMCERIQSS